MLNTLGVIPGSHYLKILIFSYIGYAKYAILKLSERKVPQHKIYTDGQRDTQIFLKEKS